MPWEWDEAKNAANLSKHGIDFETAVHVFFDGFLRIREDWHGGEQRWHSFGMIGNAYIVVIHTGRIDEVEAGAIGRLISARRMTSREKRWYEQTHT